MDSPKALRDGLARFTGPSPTLHRNALTPWMLYTEGVRYFAEHAGSMGYAVIDRIGLRMRSLAQHERALHIKLIVADGRGMLTVTDARTERPQLSPFRFRRLDCPDGEWEFYLEDGNEFVLMLPNER